MSSAALRAPRAASGPDPAQGAVRLAMTRAGWFMALTCLGIGAAAANTANNLLYLLLGLLLSAFPLSALLARSSLRRLEGELLVPPEARAGERVDAAVELRSATGASVGVIAEVTGTAVETGARGLAHVGAEAATLVVPVRLARRGPARLELVARCPFPFRMLEARKVLAAASVLVLPRVEREDVPEAATSAADSGARPVRGEGSEILNVREWRAGDDARRMHWKASARLDRPMIREHAIEQERRATVVVDAAAAMPASSADAAAVARGEAAAEDAIARAAGAVESLVERGWAVRLLAPGLDATGTARELHRALALLDAGLMRPDGWWRGAVRPGDAVHVVRARARAGGSGP